jgi:bifunctional UDP-N-acetylglucosamine pyrophosphorylase/glucosamine-1-phosphate N-acetyltransferase
VIGFATEVKSSVLAHHVWTHMSYIGDSIIGTNVSFGGGSLTGNFRLDEQEISSMVEGEKILTGLIKFGTVVGDGCRIGIRSAINPGIKIGTGTFVSSGCLINQDIPDQSYTSMKAGELQIRPNRVLPPSTAEREQYRRTLLTEP